MLTSASFASAFDLSKQRVQELKNALKDFLSQEQQDAAQRLETLVSEKLKSQGVGPRPCRHWGAAVCHWGACVCVIGVYVCVIGVYLRVSLGCICVCHWGVVRFTLYPLPSTGRG